ncbi:MAG: hypothetical protein BWK79_18800 [Beggiatoa sp. IS2]|nr:MAG: hypothetical protein BWK79_18800 [Beggiatoa sp. IS2]
MGKPIKWSNYLTIALIVIFLVGIFSPFLYIFIQDKQAISFSKLVFFAPLTLILISGSGIALIYNQTLERALNSNKLLSEVNLQLHFESEHLRQTKEALFDQAEALFYQASHDGLTNLCNRHEFEQQLQNLLYSVSQQGEQHALCYMDLDLFKIVNDMGGHAAGDELLRQISQLLEDKIHKPNTLARVGGDEFAVLVRNCQLEQALDVAEILRTTAKNLRFIWERKVFDISGSIGVVLLNEKMGDLTAVMSAADAACYLAKENGGNRTHVYEYDDQTIQRNKVQMAWVSRIHRAFEDNRFRLYHQLIVPVDKTVVEKKHYEVLIRMIGEAGELLSAAERYNLMPELDRWIVKTLFEWLANHPQAVEELAVCSVNLSGLSISDRSFRSFLLTQLQNYALPPRKVCFEITETAAIANLSEATKFIKTFKDQGCRFSLDDFGSGMSSFGY